MSDNSRRYLASHSWITFSLDLLHAPYTFWILLGAIESKCKHLAGIPLRPEKQEELNHISLLKGVQATTAIEGNTLSAEEISRIIADPKGYEPPKSQEYRTQEIQNMLAAYNSIINDIAYGNIQSVSFETVKHYNYIILQNLELNNDITPGEIRTYPVSVGHYRGAPAEDCEFLLNNLFSWLNQDWGLGSKNHIIEGVLKAIISHLYIAWIHPFCDGNGRTARTLEFRLLMDAGVPLNAAHLLTSYYNETRTQYYASLEASSAHKNGVIDFIQYSLQGFVDALDSQIKTILDEQLDITWENYVHESCFGGKLTQALRRRRDLLLEISKSKEPIPLNFLRRYISEDLAKLYQDKARVLMRDINYLLQKGLLTKNNSGYKADKNKMKAFLPLVKQS